MASRIDFENLLPDIIFIYHMRAGSAQRLGRLRDKKKGTLRSYSYNKFHISFAGFSILPSNSRLGIVINVRVKYEKINNDG